MKHKIREAKIRGGIKGLEKRRREAIRNGGYFVTIGLPAGSGAYPDGTSVIDVGVWNEFGTADGRVPERSFLRSGMRANRKDHAKLIRKIGSAVDRGDRDPVEGLELLGTQAASDVAEQIVSVSAPPNAPSTIARKGSSNPLVDTGLLRQSVTHRALGRDES